MSVQIWFESVEAARENEDDLTATRRFTAFMESSLDSFFDVMTSRQIPKKYERHPKDRRLVAINIAPDQRQDAPRLWDIEVEYTSNPKDKDKKDNPLERPAEIEWDTTEENQVIERDAEGDPLLNTAGDLIEGIEEPESHWVIKVKKNVAKVPKYILEYDLAVNDGSVRIRGLSFPKETLWLRRLHISELKTENDVDFYEFSFELHYKSKTWVRKFPNRGYHEIAEVEAGAFLIEEKQRILINGEPPAEPQFLDENGRMPRKTVTIDGVQTEVVKHPLDPEDIHLVEYSTKKKKPFNVLPFK